MTLKVTQGHRNNLCWISHKSLSINSIINNDFILQCFWDITTFRLTIQCTWLALTSRSPSFSKTKLKLQAARALPFMCKHIENNTRCISRGMGIRKVSNSKSDLPGHSRSPVTVPFATISLSCAVSKILSLISQSLKTSRDPEHIPWGVFYHVCNRTPQYQPVHENWSASLHRFENITGAPKLKI